ncbi:MAG: glycosyltransferase, partial [Cephaloticoccus sp.]|nr:glycosyltransferase [Cephaloticoccus sp.]
HHASEIPGLTGLGYHLRADKLALIYQAADLFLGTATEEAFGQTVMEAQLCGLPTVAFQAGGVVEIIRHGITGLLVPNADATAAVEAIRTLIASPAQLTDYACLAREHAIKRFSLSAHAQRWQSYLTGERLTHCGPKPAVLAYPLHEAEDLRAPDQHRPSWPTPEDLVTAEHGQVVEQNTAFTGPVHPAVLFKLYEMGYHAGDFILEIGPVGARAAVTTLQGAQAHPARTLPPVYIALADTPQMVDTMRTALVSANLSQHCHLLNSSVARFFSCWEVEPTMIYLQGHAPDTSLVADLKIISQSVRPGTPVLLANYLSSTQNVIRLAADQWVGEGFACFMGCFGLGALYITQAKVN